MNNVQNIDALIGRPVLSFQTANKLGHVHDLVVNPLKGQMVGLSMQMVDESYVLVDQMDIHGIGADAVMIDRDEALVSPDRSELRSLPLAKTNLIGVKVITEGGELLGAIANIYIHVAEQSFLIYEVRSSILDKLLGHALYFPASLGCALSEDATRLVVANATEKAAHNLESVASQLFGAHEYTGPRITVRSHSN